MTAPTGNGGSAGSTGNARVALVTGGSRGVGKGVATAAGLFIGLYLPAALLAIATWLLVFILTRISSLAALIATPLTLPLLAWQLPAALLPACVLTLLIVWRHRANLRDLLAGRERHF